MKPVLSQVSKLDNVKSFDLPLSTCQDRCMYFDVRKEVRKLTRKKIKGSCYTKNNPRLRFKKKVLKFIRNLKLIRSNRFVKVLTKEILKDNCRKFRFFSSGQVENLEQLIKVLQVCKICHMVNFAIMVNSDIILCQLIQSGYKIPKNANLLLSNYEPNKKTPEFMKNYLIESNIGVTQTTLKNKLATCEASKVKNGTCGTCEKCYYNKDIWFKIHGRYNEKRVLDLDYNNYK